MNEKSRVQLMALIVVLVNSVGPMLDMLASYHFVVLYFQGYSWVAEHTVPSFCLCAT